MASSSYYHRDGVRLPEAYNVVEGGNDTSRQPLELIRAGSCAYRDPTTGVACGCHNFWLAATEAPHFEANLDNCACGHHACFHMPNEVLGTSAGAGVETGTARNPGVEVLQHLREVGRLLSQFVPEDRVGRNLLPAPDRNLETLASSDHHIPREMEPATSGYAPDRAYQPPSFSSLLAAFNPMESKQQNQSLGVEHNDSAGLGVLLPEGVGPALPNFTLRNDLQSGVPMDVDYTNSPSFNRLMGLFDAYDPGPRDPNLPSTVGGSADGNARTVDSSQAPAGSVDRLLSEIDVRRTPIPPDSQDWILSSTERATPSIAISPSEHNSIPPAPIRPARTTAVARNHSAQTGQRMVNMPPPSLGGQRPRGLNRRPQESREQLVTQGSQSATPPLPILQDSSSLQELAHHLKALRMFVAKHGNQLRGIYERLDAVEVPQSFSQNLRDQDLVDKVDGLETRIIEVEGNMDHHKKILDRVDVDPSDDESIIRRRQPVKPHNGSDVSQTSTSNHSAGSGLAQPLKLRVEELEERMMNVERHLPPSSSRPLTLEVVFIPWGRNLGGLWVQPEGSKMASSRYMTQDLEEWTTSQNVPSASRAAFSLQVGHESGWSSEAIHDWAINTEEWLVPRACGVKSVAYHRLKSRGFVRIVNITKPGARDARHTIVNAFHDLLNKVSSNDLENVQSHRSDDEGQDSRAIGLNAPFIPLRKIPGVSKLQFLTKSEMVTPALWTTEFLMADIVMRTAGGPRRLFITHREGYLQPGNELYPSWTWERVRALPIPASIEDVHDRTWAKHSILDAPPISLNTSFASQQSATPPHGDGSGHPFPDVVPNDPNQEQPVTPIFVKSREDEAESEILAPGNPEPITPATEPNITSRRQSGSKDTLQAIVTHLYPSSESAYSRGGTHEPGQSPTAKGPMALDQFEDGQSVASSDDPDYQPGQKKQERPQRYNLRHMSRTVSNPVKTKTRKDQGPQPRSFSANLPAEGSFKRTRGFEKISNQLIGQIPNFVQSSGTNIGPKQRSSDAIFGNKRRRLSSYKSYDDHPPLRRQRSSSVSFIQTRSSSKRAVTPAGAYPTPYSGDFHDVSSQFGLASDDANLFDENRDDGNLSNHGSDDEEVWEGVEDDGEDHLDAAKGHVSSHNEAEDADGMLEAA
jgi:hypothetical protein